MIEKISFFFYGSTSSKSEKNQGKIDPHKHPKTYTNQMLRMDPQQMIKRMANEKQYLEPLSLFKNAVCYSNVRYDNRVSCRSGSIIPPHFNYDKFWERTESNKLECSFYNVSREECECEVKLGENENDHYFVDRKNKNSLGRRKKMERIRDAEEKDDFDDEDEDGDGDGDEDGERVWFAKLYEEVKWERVLACMNQNYMMRRWCHTWLSVPVKGVKNCAPILESIKEKFIW